MIEQKVEEDRQSADLSAAMEQVASTDDGASEEPMSVSQTMSWEQTCYAAMSVYSFPRVDVGVSRRQPNRIWTPPLN